MAEGGSNLDGWEISVLFALFMTISCAWQVFIAIITFLNSFYGDAKKIWLNRLKEEVLDVGVISLFLVFLQPFIANICVSSSHGDPSDEPSASPPPPSVAFHRLRMLLEAASEVPLAARRALAGGSAKPCSAGKRHLFPTDSITTAHYLLFFVAVVHIVYSLLTFTLTLQRFSTWTKWEARARRLEMDGAESLHHALGPGVAEEHGVSRTENGGHLGRLQAAPSILMRWWKVLLGGVDVDRFKVLRGLFQLRARAYQATAFSSHNLHYSMVCENAMQIDIEHMVAHGWLQAMIVAVFTLYTTKAYQIVWMGGLSIVVQVVVVAKLQWVLSTIQKFMTVEGRKAGYVEYRINMDSDVYKEMTETPTGPRVTGNYLHPDNEAEGWGLDDDEKLATSSRPGSRLGTRRRSNDTMLRTTMSTNNTGRVQSGRSDTLTTRAGAGSGLPHNRSGVYEMRRRGSGPIAEGREELALAMKLTPSLLPPAATSSSWLDVAPAASTLAADSCQMQLGSTAVPASWMWHASEAPPSLTPVANPIHLSERRLMMLTPPGPVAEAHETGPGRGRGGGGGRIGAAAGGLSEGSRFEAFSTSTVSGGSGGGGVRVRGGGIKGEGSGLVNILANSASEGGVPKLGSRSAAGDMSREGGGVGTAAAHPARMSALSLDQQRRGALRLEAPIDVERRASGLSFTPGFTSGCSNPLYDEDPPDAVVQPLRTALVGLNGGLVRPEATVLRAAPALGGVSGGFMGNDGQLAVEQSNRPDARNLEGEFAEAVVVPQPPPAAVLALPTVRGLPAHAPTSQVVDVFQVAPSTGLAPTAHHVASQTRAAAVAVAAPEVTIPSVTDEHGSKAAPQRALLPPYNKEAGGDENHDGGTGTSAGHSGHGQREVVNDVVESKLHGLFWFGRPQLLMWITHVTHVQTSLSMTLCLYYMLSHGTKYSILQETRRLLQVWLPLLVANLGLMLYIGWVAVPLYALVTTTCSRNPRALQEHIRRHKKVEEEEGGITGFILEQFIRCFRPHHHNAARHHAHHGASHGGLLNDMFLAKLANQAGVITATGEHHQKLSSLGALGPAFRQFLDIWLELTRIARGEALLPPGGRFLLNEVDLSELRCAFDALDGDGSGFVTSDELFTHLQLSGTLTTRAELKAMINEIDGDGNNKASFAEFVVFMVFCFLDGNGNGTVEVHDIQRASEELKMDLAPVDLEAMVALADPDGDRKIGLRQFSNLFKTVDIPDTPNGLGNSHGSRAPASGNGAPLVPQMTNGASSSSHGSPAAVGSADGRRGNIVASTTLAGGVLMTAGSGQAVAHFGGGSGSGAADVGGSSDIRDPSAILQDKRLETYKRLRVNIPSLQVNIPPTPS